MPRVTQLNGARLRVAGLLVVPAGVTLGLALASGGFFPDSVSVAVAAVIVAFGLGTATSRSPFRGVNACVAGVALALIAFVAWTLISGSWSHAPARATFEYVRNLLYAGTFVLTGLLGRSARRARLLLGGLALVSVGVSAAAAATWLLPDVFSVAANIGRDRLSWPTSYWNATGLLAALALVWASSLSISATQSPRVRVLAAMATPIMVATLIFSVSRGALAVAILGLVVAVATIRSSSTPGGLLAVAPAIAAAAAITLGVKGLNVAHPAAPALRAGHRDALLLLAVALAGGALRAVLLRLDGRLARARPPWTRAQIRILLALATAAIVVAFVAFGGPHAVRHAVDRFVSTREESVGRREAASQRLTRLGNNGRIEEWRVAWHDGFLAHPVEGTGAGTYATLWTRYGTTYRRVLNAHSLYLEELAELGLVGGALLIGAIVAILVALARRARGPEREVWAALLATGVMWAVHAGVDWDWQMPAVTAWFFAAGGLAMSAPADRPRREPDPRLRWAVALGCLLLIVTPATVWRSQTRLIAAVSAFERDDCSAAERDALESNAALGSRADPFEVISYCEAGAGRFALALDAIHAAEARDPENWELRYSDALISAVAGRDPRQSARLALALYPRSPLTRTEAQAFRGDRPAVWRRFALAAPLPVPHSTR